MNARTYPNGVHHLSGELSREHIKEIVEQLPDDLSDRLPDFDDETGNKGYLVWKKKDGHELPEFVVKTLSGLHRVAVNTNALRVVQVNCQQPHGEQKFHTDAPFSSSMTFHLSPNGLFEYKSPERDDFAQIKVQPGDVVALANASELVHRGRNTSHLSRFTISMFFNGKAFSL